MDMITRELTKIPRARQQFTEILTARHRLSNFLESKINRNNIIFCLLLMKIDNELLLIKKNKNFAQNEKTSKNL